MDGVGSAGHTQRAGRAGLRQGTLQNPELWSMVVNDMVTFSAPEATIMVKMLRRGLRDNSLAVEEEKLELLTSYPAQRSRHQVVETAGQHCAAQTQT